MPVNDTKSYVPENLHAALVDRHPDLVIIREFYFARPRLFRFDIAFTGPKLAIEIDGGVWAGGRHTRGKGYIRDAEKGRLAVLHGWGVLHYVPAEIVDKNRQVIESTLDFIDKVLAARM